MLTPRRASSLAVLACCVLFAGACAAPIRRPAVALDPKPLLLHLPGIAGDNPFERSFVSALTAGGFDADARLYDWTHGTFWITTLQAYERNRDAGARLAEHIVALSREHPGRPIFLTSDSGGAGPTVWALEHLPDDVTVEAVVLLCPALSPDYDLSAALSRVRRTMVAFHSRGDGFVLGFGTQFFGTIDGRRVPAAGHVGFSQPAAAADPSQYAKLRSVPYDNAWFRVYGHGGDHTGAMGARFASGYLAPLLTRIALDGRDPPATAPVAASKQTEATSAIE